MDEAWIRAFWAPAAALVIAGLVLIVLLRTGWRRSRRGRLAIHVRERAKCRRMAIEAVRQRDAARGRVETLEAKADKVPPKRLDEARGALADADRLCGIRSDQLKVAENHLRRIITEEYPPARHERLRKRYDLGEHADASPFTFDGG